jgi:hypothetical protein
MSDHERAIRKRRMPIADRLVDAHFESNLLATAFTSDLLRVLDNLTVYQTQAFLNKQYGAYRTPNDSVL